MADRIEGLSIGLDLDSIGVQEGFQKLKRDMKTMNSEMKKNMSVFDRADESLEKYETSLSGLNKKLELQKKVTEAAKQEMKKMVDQYGSGSKKAQNATRNYNDQAAALNNLERYTKDATERLDKMRQEQKKVNSVFGKATQKLKDYSDQMNETSERMSSSGQSLTAGLTLPLAGVGIAASTSAMQLHDASQLMVGSLGATGEEASQLRKDMRSVWEKGFGNSPEELARDMVTIKQNIQGINNGKELQKVTKDMLTLANVTQADMGEATRGVNQLMHNFGLTAEEAMDLFTKGQQEGLNYSDEMFDNIAEYAPLFKQMGFSAEDYFTILANGTKNGAYNLDYINDLMKEFDIRVRDGSEKTSDAFAEMSTETQNLFKKFENGKATTDELFNAILPELEGMEDQVKANQIGVELFGTKWEDMGADTVYALDDVNESMKNVDGSMQQLRKSQDKTFSKEFKQTLRGMLDALKPLGEALLGIARDVTPYLKKMSEWFASLPESTQKTAVGIGAVVAALGPLTMLFGGGLRVLSLFSGGLGKITGRLAKTKANSKGASKSLGIFSGAADKSSGKALKSAGKFGKAAGSLSKIGKFAGVARFGLAGLGGPLGLLATVAIPKMIEGGVKLVKHMKEDSIPAVKGFGDQVSDTTTKAVLSYKNLNDKATTELNQLFWSGETITKEGKKKLTTLFDQMGNQIAKSMEDDFKQSYNTLSKFLADAKNLSKKEQEAILTNMKEGHEKQKKELQEKEARIKEIMNKASKEKRALTEAEKNEINRIQNEMKKTAVQTMSESEKEQTAIMEKLKTEAGNITARQAATTVKNSQKAKKGAVKEANEQYDKVVEAAVHQRDETGNISDEQADAIIKEAKRQRDESIEKAKSMHKNVVKQAKEQAEGQVDEIDWATGEVLSNWDKTVRGVAKAVNWVSKGINWVLDKIGIPEIPMWEPPGYAKGTKRSGHPGGPAVVGEKGRELAYIPGVGAQLVGTRGPELIGDFPKGSAVLPNPQTEKTLKHFGFPGYAGGIGDFFSSLLDGPKSMVKKAFDLFKPDLPNLGGSLQDMMTGSISYMKDKATSYLIGKVKSIFGGGFDKGGFGPPFRLTSSAGWRVHPIFGTPRFHAGDDYGAPAGTPIPSKSGGRVVFSGYNSARGNYVQVKSGQYDFIYQHNRRNLVSEGDFVRPNQIIGTVGSTGHSTGPHLHFETRKNGAFIAPSALGFASGGYVGTQGLYQLAEEGHGEWIIPTDPSRRTVAQKLLALAGRDIESKNKRPNQLSMPANSNANDSYLKKILEKLEGQISETQEAVRLLSEIALKDLNVYMDSDLVGGLITKNMIKGGTVAHRKGRV